MKKLLRFSAQTLLISLMVASCGLLASAAPLNSTSQAISLTATLTESLTLSLSGNSVNFPLIAGSATNAGSTPITATTTWVLGPSRTSVTVYAYFASATQALADTGTDYIPSSAFFIADNAGTSTAVTTTGPTGFGGANAALSLGATAITGTNRSSSRTDAMTFNINLSTLTQLPAGTYTGTLNIEAQATP